MALAALHGLVGVGAAAMGAHLTGGATMQTGAYLQMIHALAALAALALLPKRWRAGVAALFVAGAACFAGALYTSVLTGVSLGPVAPTGGILMMLGWLGFAIAALRPDEERPPH